MNRRHAFISLVLFIVFLSNALPASAFDEFSHLWSQRFGSDTYSDYGQSVAIDGADNVVVTGSFGDTADFGGGDLVSNGYWDIFLAKYDATGTHLWSKRFGGTSDDNGYSVTADASGNVVVVGGFQETVDFGGGNRVSAGGDDIFIAKYDANGMHLWSHRFGSVEYDAALSVAVDALGDLWVTGYFCHTVDFGGGDLECAGATDIFLAKYDANGVHLWSKRFGGTEYDGALSLAVDGSENASVTGYFGGTVDFGGGDLESAGGNDIFLAKYGSGGAHLWSQRFGDGTHDNGASVTTDGSRNVLVAGRFQGTVDFGGGDLESAGETDIFLAKYDASGVHQWSRRFGSTNIDNVSSVAADESGNVTVTGDFFGTVDFGGGDLISVANDIFVAEYNAVSGAHFWSERFGDASSDHGKAVAVDGAGSVVVTGDFRGTVDFGGGDLSAGETDIFLAKYADRSVAVAIASFDAEAHDGVVALRAVFRSNLAVEAVRVYRSRENSGFARIATVTDVEHDHFAYIDRDVMPGTTYRYQIGVVDGDGEFLSPIALASVGRSVARLEQNAPNPFNPSTFISFTLPDEAQVTLSIHDAGGALVRVLLDAVRDRGTHRVAWDGRNDQGTPMSSGVYFYRLHAGKFTESRKMVLVK
jgi:hypothetical protein